MKTGIYNRIIVIMETTFMRSYSFSFYVKVDGKYVKCYNFLGISDEDLTISFKKKKLINSRKTGRKSIE